MRVGGMVPAASADRVRLAVASDHRQGPSHLILAVVGAYFQLGSRVRRPDFPATLPRLASAVEDYLEERRLPSLEDYSVLSHLRVQRHPFSGRIQPHSLASNLRQAQRLGACSLGLPGRSLGTTTSRNQQTPVSRSGLLIPTQHLRPETQSLGSPSHSRPPTQAFRGLGQLKVSQNLHCLDQRLGASDLRRRKVRPTVSFPRRIMLVEGQYSARHQAQTMIRTSLPEEVSSHQVLATQGSHHHRRKAAISSTPTT